MSRSSPPVDDQEVAEPRRGGRVRKQVERFEPPAGSKSKAQTRHGDDNEDSESKDDPSEAESEDAAPSRKKRAAQPSKGARKPAGAPRRQKKAATKKSDNVGGEGAEGASSQIKDDCELFNALLQPDIALVPLIEDWIDTYQQAANDETSERASVHQLILLIIRSCGLNVDLEEDEAMDVDGILDALERIQDESLQNTAAVYPLIARTKEARILKTNLDIFITNFVKTLALTPLLYQTPESTTHSYPVLQLVFHWLHSMSSSTLRPIRHTSTHLTLKVCSALCDVAAKVSSELSLKQRQRDAEEKKGGKGPAAKKKLASLAADVKASHEKKTLLEGYLQESFSIMYVHRVRDLDPLIRTECLKELGVWLNKYSEMYNNTRYLSYFSRGCNDPDNKARLETTKALPGLMTTETDLNRARTVIARLTPRLIEMALRDIDTNVRSNALAVIADIDKSGILEDENGIPNLQISRLIFDKEPKVRRAVGGFVRSLWEQRVDSLKSEWSAAKPAIKKRAGKVTDDEMEARFGYKALATLLLETAESIDKAGDQAESSKQAERFNAALAGRATAAVEALWDTFEELEQWENLVEYLLLDHSQAGDIWLLEEQEESLLLQVLVACIKWDNTDGDEEDEQTKKLMNVIPRLYTKHQADSDRMTGLLTIPAQLKLSLYQDMGKGQAYEALWDDVIKQFLDHTEPSLLQAAIKAIVHLASNTPGEAANNVKLAELDDTVFSVLRDTIDGEEVSNMNVTGDRLLKLEAILLRISLLQRSRDLTSAVDDEEGGQSSGWDIICAFAERGEIGYKEEAKVNEHAIQNIFLHLTWLFKNFSEEDADIPERVEALKAKRDRGRDIFERLALNDRSNVADAVRRQAFIAYLNLHILFSERSSAAPAAKILGTVLDDHVQAKLANSFKGIVERHASDREELTEDESDESMLAGPQMLFLQLVSVFVGAVRCSILDVIHAQEPLSHYGRFGQVYDAIVKRLIDPLRDEGIYNREETTVQATASAAIQNSFNLFLDTDGEEPVNTIALGKLIATAFIVQGNHFVIVKQIHPDEVEDLHKTCISYLGRKLTQAKRTHANAKGKQAKDHAMTRIHQVLTFSRVLVNLLGPISGKQALEIKSYLEETIGEVMPIGLGKQWDAYRSYEKRLGTIAGKDPNVKVVVQKKAVEPVFEETDGEDEDVEQTPTKSARKRKADEVVNAAGADGDEEQEVELEAADEFEEIQVANESIDLDIDFDLELPESQDERPRSPSVEPAVKRRRTERRI